MSELLAGKGREGQRFKEDKRGGGEVDEIPDAVLESLFSDHEDEDQVAGLFGDFEEEEAAGEAAVLNFRHPDHHIPSGLISLFLLFLNVVCRTVGYCCTFINLGFVRVVCRAAQHYSHLFFVVA